MAEDLAKGYLLSAKKLETLDARITQIKSADKLPESGCLFVAFDFDSPGVTRDTLLQLRRTQAYRYTPFFTWDTIPHNCELLIDGKLEESAYSKAKDIHERLAIASENDTQEELADIQLILTRFLFTRKKLRALPQITFENPFGFTYPVMEALNTEGSANDHWYVLNSLVKRDYLVADETLNELQTCTNCEGGLLNFKNCCPNCQSVDLHIEPFVHCFTCGNVGPVKEFMRHQELVCNRCQTTLKHIGIDYDKPLEDKICERCQHRFFEPSTLFVCLVCEEIGHPESLNTRKLQAFSLTRKGEEFAKNRLQKISVEIGAFFELINFSLLELIIDWQARVAERHNAIQFVAGVIYADNINALIDEIGFLKTEQQLVLFYENMRSLFRKTDLLSVDDEKLFCLLTMTSLEHIDVIQERIRNYDKNAPKDAPKLDVKFGFLSSTEIIEGGLDKELLVNEILSRVSV